MTGIMPKAQMDALEALGWDFVQTGSNAWEWMKFNSNKTLLPGKYILPTGLLARQGSKTWRDDLAKTEGSS